MKDGNCVGAVRVECIEMAAIFIGLVDPSRRRWSQKQYRDEDRSNFNKNAMRFNTLINAASQEYSGGG